MEPRQGAFAVCSLGTLGLILSTTPVEVTYPDNTKGLAWTGIHLTNRIAPFGSPWCSRNPVVLAGMPHVKLDTAEVSSWQESCFNVLLRGSGNVRRGDLPIVEKICKPTAAPERKAGPVAVPKREPLEDIATVSYEKYAVYVRENNITVEVHPDTPARLVEDHKHYPGHACHGCFDLYKLNAQGTQTGERIGG